MSCSSAPRRPSSGGHGNNPSSTDLWKQKSNLSAHLFFTFFFIDVGTCPAFVHASIRTSFMLNYFVHLASSSQECTAFLYIPRISSRPVSLSLLAKRARALITTSSCPWEMKQYPHLIHFPFRITYACNTDM